MACFGGKSSLVASKHISLAESELCQDSNEVRNGEPKSFTLNPPDSTLSTAVDPPPTLLPLLYPATSAID